MNKDIINRNSKGQLHGYQERRKGWYCYNGKLRFKGFYNNNIPIDYFEFYYFSGQLVKFFHI